MITIKDADGVEEEEKEEDNDVDDDDEEEDNELMCQTHQWLTSNDEDGFDEDDVGGDVLWFGFHVKLISIDCKSISEGRYFSTNFAKKWNCRSNTWSSCEELFCSLRFLGAWQACSLIQSFCQ